MRSRKEGASDWLIRSFEDGDQTAILELFETSFHHRRSLGDWEWKYLHNPTGKGAISLAFSSDGKLGAHYGSYSSRFHEVATPEPKIVLASQIGDTMTSKPARRVGIGDSSLLARITRHHFTHYCDGVVGFNYGFNTGKIQRYYKRSVPGSRFLEAAPYRVLTAPSRAVADSPLRVIRIKELDDRWDLLFSKVANDYKFLAERKRNSLQWRYFDRPDVDYLMYGVFDGTSLAGWSVFRDQGESLSWGDALFDRLFPDGPATLLAHVREQHARGSERKVEAWFPPRPQWWDQTLRELGFQSQPEPQDLGLIFKPFVEQNLMHRFQEHLYYTKGDGDLF